MVRDCCGGQKVKHWWTEVLLVVRRLDIGGQRLWRWSEGCTVVDRDCGGGQKVRLWWMEIVVVVRKLDSGEQRI